MKPENIKEQELLVLDNLFHVQYKYDAGRRGSPFYAEMKENKRLFANKCPQCGRMSVPPRPFCGLCAGARMSEWVEQGDTGTVEVLTIQYYKFDHPRTGEALDVPWASGQIRLDGGALVRHYLYPANPKEIKVGDRVKAVWRDNRRGHFTDIKHFAKVEDDGTRFKPSQSVPMSAGPHSIHSQFKIKYKKTAGSVNSRFLTELRDRATLLATRCGVCGKTYAPAMEMCDQCCVPLTEFLPLSGRGVLTGFTIVRKAESQHPVSVPFVTATIKMEGADTAMTHILGEVDPGKVFIGMEVEPVFKNERTGSILDIKYFKPRDDAARSRPWGFDD